ncbi:UPF0182 family protein [Flexivirga alba]|uniref:UPF0182 family protein n=1 Tax=Flexivirga alba TaxID=702742 RepID=A0ABW2AFJ5_9MICO
MTSSDEPADSGEHDQHAATMVRRFGPVGARRVIILVVAIIAVLVLAQVWANVWTTQLWFKSIGYSSVFRTEYLTKGTMFVVGAVLTGGLIWVSMWLAYRHRPVYAPVTAELDSMDRYREAIEPFRRAAFWVVPLVFALFAGSAAIGQWKTALLWLNRQSFGTTDPEFHKDIGFYVFTLPWLQVVVGFLTMALILSLISAVVMHYLYGGIALRDKEFAPLEQRGFICRCCWRSWCWCVPWLTGWAATA